MAKKKYTAVVMEQDGEWVGWVKDCEGVNGQAESREELISDLEVTLKESLKEGFFEHEVTLTL